MKTTLRLLTLGLFLLLPLSAAYAQTSVSPISNQTVSAEDTLNVNVVAVDPDGGSLVLTASLPAFATLNDPKTGDGIVVTTLTMTPLGADVGTHAASVTSTAIGSSDTEDFQITVAAADANQPPRVTAPASKTATEGSLLEFGVTASDADADAITSLAATNLPVGASFTANAGFTSGTFNWTPDLKQAGHYDVIFVASNAQSDSATTHLTVLQSNLGPVAITPIADVSMAEGDTLAIGVIATDPDEETIELSATLPAFGTLNPPTESAGAASLQTTITLMPGSGTAGTYQASVTAKSGGDTATEPFTITVTGPGLEAAASLIGSFNTHKKFICFKVVPVEESFDLLDVSLSSIKLSFGGGTIGTVRPTHLAYDCDGDGDGDDIEDGDGGESDTTDCVPSHVMACFAMSDIQTLFEGSPLPSSLADATIEGELNGGGAFIATIGGKHVTDENGNGKGKLALRIHPNPMNPSADISFTLAQPGRVRVAVYDLAGRLVATIHEGDLPAGTNTVSWNGSTRSGGRAASSVYFVSVEAAGVRGVQRVTVLK